MSPKGKGITSPIQLGGLTEARAAVLLCRAAAQPPPRPRPAPAPLRGPPVCAGCSPWARYKNQMHIPRQKPGRRHARLHLPHRPRSRPKESTSSTSLALHMRTMPASTCSYPGPYSPCKAGCGCSQPISHALIGHHASSSRQYLHALKPARPASARVSAARPHPDAHLQLFIA